MGGHGDVVVARGPIVEFWPTGFDPVGVTTKAEQLLMVWL